MNRRHNAPSRTGNTFTGEDCALSGEKVGVSRSRREMRSPTKPTQDKEKVTERQLRWLAVFDVRRLMEARRGGIRLRGNKLMPGTQKE